MSSADEAALRGSLCEQGACGVPAARGRRVGGGKGREKVRPPSSRQAASKQTGSLSVDHHGAEHAALEQGSIRA